MNPFADAGTALLLVERIAATGVCLATLEMLSRPRHLRDDGLLSWPVAQLRHRRLAAPRAVRMLDPFFRYPNVLVLLAARLAAAAVLAAGLADGAPHTVLLVTVTVLSVAIPLRSPFGLDGADQMAVFVFAMLSLARLVPTEAVVSASLWFVALQACLSYLTAGVAKAVSPEWRGPAALVGISGTQIYGAAPVAAFLAGNPALTVWLSRSVIAAECAFPLALVLPYPASLVLLAGGLLFHALSAVFMGLNTFFWSFAATYPAILYCGARLHG